MSAAEIEVLTIRELKQTAAETPREFVIHAQLDTVGKKTTRGGAPFYQLNFADSEESLVIRAWENSPNFATCEQLRDKQFFEVRGEFYQNLEHRSLDAKSWELRPLSNEEAASVLAGSADLRAKQERDYAFILNATAGIADPRLNGLCGLFLDQFGDRFRRTGAARKNHHARRGGLVEHVAQMMRTAIQVCVAYPMLNRDLMIAGVLFHDVGKLWENCYDEDGFTMPYSEVSELLSHIPFGMEIVNKLWRDLQDDDETANAWRYLEPNSSSVRLHLLHLIASHHGELEFGAPVVPKTPEAQALHYIDNLDAKMEMFEQGYLTSPQIARNVQERVFPLPGKLVRPLAKFEAEFEPPHVEEAPISESEPEFEEEPQFVSETVEVVPEKIEVLSESALEAKISALSDALPIPEPTEEELAELEAMENESDDDGEEEPF